MEYRHGTTYYHATSLGIKAFEAMFQAVVIYQKPADRDVAYLRHQIDFYCQFHEYNLGDDPAGYVFEDFQKYYWSKSVMSHTMADIVNEFKSDLKRLFPRRIG